MSECYKFDKTYFIYNPEDHSRLPDNKPYWYFITHKGAFHKKYFQANNWEEKYGKTVTYSNYSKYSIIKNNLLNPHIFTTKHKLYQKIDGKYYALPYVMFNIEQNYLEQIKQAVSLDNRLWFMKKTADTTYGGYDVFPIRADKDFVANLNKAIEESNQIKKYQSSNFVLQLGIEQPLLLDKKKFDFRMYGLLVWANGHMCLYFFQYGLIRKTLHDFVPMSNKKEHQLTNTTFNKLELSPEDYAKLTELLTPEHSLYKYYDRMRDIYVDIMKLYKDDINISENKYGYHIIGFDFMIDSKDDKLYVLEINRSPAIYYDERIRTLHKNMEYKMINDEYFDITINRVMECNLLEKSTTYWNFCWSYRVNL